MRSRGSCVPGRGTELQTAALLPFAWHPSAVVRGTSAQHISTGLLGSTSASAVSGHIFRAVLSAGAFRLGCVCRHLKHLAVEGFRGSAATNLHAVALPSTLQSLSIGNHSTMQTSMLPRLRYPEGLQALRLAGPHGSVPSAWLAGLCNLTYLALSNARLQDSEHALLRMPHLRHLELAHTGLGQAALSGLAALTELTALLLSAEMDAQFPPPLPRLRRLAMRSCSIGGDWQEMYAMHSSMHGDAAALTCLQELVLIDAERPRAGHYQLPNQVHAHGHCGAAATAKAWLGCSASQEPLDILQRCT